MSKRKLARSRRRNSKASLVPLVGDSSSATMRRNTHRAAASKRVRPTTRRHWFREVDSYPILQSPQPVVPPPLQRTVMREIEHANQRYEDLYEFAPVGYVSFNRAGRIEEINLTATQLFGLPRE